MAPAGSITARSFVLLVMVCSCTFLAGAVPSIASLAPPALPARRLLGLPQVQNFWAASGLRRDMISLGTLAWTPLNGNMQNSTMRVDGLDATLAESRWGICEGTRAGAAGDVAIANAVRMPFESRSLLQRWTLAPADAGAGAGAGDTVHALLINLDGPFFRACDVPGGPSCGWGTSFPVDRTNFAASLSPIGGGGALAMVTVDGTTGIAAASTLWWRSGGSGALAVSINAANNTFDIAGNFSGITVLQQAIAAGNDAPAALAALAALLDEATYDAAFDGACALFEQRWQTAFEQPVADGGTGTHFAGNLPVLSSNRPDVDRLYYWAALAMVSLERTNLLSGPRQFVISQGPSNSLDGSAGMGGSGQFIWDESFAATALSLLEPDAIRDQLDFLMNSSTGVLGTAPVVIPQCWDAYPPYGASPPAMGSYRFDFYSAFLHLYTYIAVNNASAWLHAPRAQGRAATGHQFLLSLNAARTGFPASTISPWLTDYGGDKRDYLEVVPSYVDVVPALQAGAAGMSLALARLVEGLGDGEYANSSALASQLRANATAIVADMQKWLWRDTDGGAWRCAYPNGTSAAVRSITDYVYVAQALALLGRNESLYLPSSIANASVAFFTRELLSPGTAWVRALSLDDPLCANVFSETPGIEDLLVMRSDWGCMGSYGGMPGFATEAAAHLTGALDGTLDALIQLAPVAGLSAPSQGIALGTPPYFALHFNDGRGIDDVPLPPYANAWPEFFDEGGDWPLFWPDTERYVQNAEASFVDAIVRTVFGWRPDWIMPTAPQRSPAAAAAIDASLYLAKQPRPGFAGTLAFLRTPLGYINVSASEAGLSWVWA